MEVSKILRQADPLLYKSSVADPDPGSGAFLIPGSGMVKNQDPDAGSTTQSYFREPLKFFDADP
jgi:hypothetical protein